MLKKVLLAFTLANFCWLQQWLLLFDGLIHYSNPPQPLEYFVSIFSVILLTALFLLLFKITPQKIRDGGLGLLLIFFSNRLYAVFKLQSCLPLFFLLSCLYFSGLLFFRERLMKGIQLGALLISPFGVLLLSQALWHGTLTPTLHSKEEIRQTIANGAPRVIWLVFDELDQKIAFEEKRDLPHLDQLRQNSLVATEAEAPGSRTILSIPSYLVGKKVSSFHAENPDDLLIEFENGWHSLKESPSLFSELKKQQKNSALIGWYHSYEKIFGKDLSYCYYAFGYPKKNLLMAIKHQWSKLLPQSVKKIIPALDPEKKYIRKSYLQNYVEIRDASLKAVKNPDLNLVYIHWPIPHPPGIFDEKRQTLSTKRETTYAENLQLVDLTVGLIRQTLEEAGLYDQTTLIITSDHGYRHKMWQIEPSKELDPRVPCIIKMAHQTEGIVYSKPFSSLLLSGFILEIISGKLKNSSDAVAYLNSHGG